MISPENKAIVLTRLSAPMYREDGILDILYALRDWLPGADNDTELVPLAQEVIAARKPKAAVAGPKKRIKAVPTHVKPRGVETWYRIPSDPDYAISNRLGAVRVTATDQNPAGQRLSPRLRKFRGQFHAFYRLSRNGKKIDLNAAFLLMNALKGGKKVTTVREGQTWGGKREGAGRKAVAVDCGEGYYTPLKKKPVNTGDSQKRGGISLIERESIRTSPSPHVFGEGSHTPLKSIPT